MKNQIGALALITQGETTVYYRQLKDGYDKLMLELAEAQGHYTAELLRGHGLQAQARMYRFNDEKDMHSTLGEEIPGARIVPIGEYDKNEAENKLAQFRLRTLRLKWEQALTGC